MKPGTERIARHLLASNSVRGTYRAMREAGVSISESELVSLRRVMIEAGERPESVAQRGGTTYGPMPSDAGFRTAAADGCARLLKRQIAAGQVFPAAMERWRNKHGLAA